MRPWRVRAAGFIWAPRQELFVAPTWTPEREDLLLKLAGEIDDEDTSLVERADDRAERFETYSEKRGHNFAVTIDWSAVTPEAYDALVIPGGRSPEYLQLDARVLSVVRHFDEARKPIAAVCHGPQILAAAGAVRGVRCQAYPAVRPQIVEAGGLWDAPAETMDSVCVDRNLVTSPAWPAHPAWMREFLRLLGTRIEP